MPAGMAETRKRTLIPDTFTNVWWYSFVYNGSYMIPNAIITAVIAAVLYKAVPKFFNAK